MKRFLLLPLLLFGLILSSCTKEEVVIPNRTIVTTIPANGWKYDNVTLTWYYAIDMPEIDDYTNEVNAIVVAISAGDGIWEAIPDVYDGYAYTYTYQRGALVLEVQGATGNTVNPPNTAKTVKITIIESR
ncbi:hypothetical protein MKQ68_13305 [Chitinophaga horti]|uniref:DUF4377 domain-containing protein n=1 Tax=Chitinophaga horti TaxID=2920382 RepID=A0ABY6IUM0_9BACT|nr:hypothetical protein [Chitinophaga horti]UYQ91070.1 hypothetical protein MKQ68_13305 [Chitinophaga horti]